MPLLQVEAEAKLSVGTSQHKGKERKPLRSLRNALMNADDKENVPHGEAGKSLALKSVGISKKTEAGAVATIADSDEGGEGGEKTTRMRGGARGKRKKAEQGSAAGESETRRCREMRQVRVLLHGGCVDLCCARV